jgi:arsenate reductase
MRAQFNVLFICTHNSARSIMAEAILNQTGRGRFRAYSAGSQPSGTVHPLALDLLHRNRIDTSTLRSKNWEEFSAPGAPAMDFVLTVCDNAAGEVCPVWPGQPMTAHWGVEDPSAVQGTAEERARAFSHVFMMLNRRIAIFQSLPIETLDKLSLQDELRRIK